MVEPHVGHPPQASRASTFVSYGCLAAATLGAFLAFWFTNEDLLLAALGSALMRMGLAGAILIGLRLYRPERPLVWYLLAGYFGLSAVRALYRAVLAYGGFWFDGHVDLATLLLSGVARCLLVAACVLLLWERRRETASWAVDDAAVLAAGLGCAFLTLHLIPLHAQGISAMAFWQNGILALVRFLGIFVPLVALAYSERIRSVPMAVFGVLLPVWALGDIVLAMRLESRLPDGLIVVLTALAYVAQLAVGLVALQPSMITLTRADGVPRADWNLGRTLTWSAVVLLPMAALWLRPPPSPGALMVVLAALSLLMLSVVWRMRRAVVKYLRLVQELDFEASHDRLTGLPNRRYLYSVYVRSTQTRLREHPVTLAVSYIDLDNLREVNDREEHSGGDALLAAVGARLRLLVDDDHVAVRVGGDEFVVLTELGAEGNGEAAAAQGAHIQAEIEDLALGGFQSRCSVGTSWAPIADDPDVPVFRQLDRLLHEADLAQAAAKRSGGGRAVLYDPSLGARSRMSSSIRRLLPQAWARGEISMAYQPVVDLRTGHPLGAESLLRWTSDELGVVPAMDAIDTAARMGLVTDLGLRILEQVLMDLRAAPIPPEARIGVNLAAPQLRPAAFGDLVRLIESSGLSHRLWLEVTEQLLVEEKRYAAGALAELRSQGVMIALDDFGTGYCGLDYVCTLPLDLVKLDKSFTQGLTDSTVRKRVTGLVVNICDAIGADAVAEGIETPGLAMQMSDLGFRYGQGYALRRPGSSLAEALRPVDLPCAR